METDPERQDTKIGTLVEGRYRITKLLGQGGMGAVYAAKHELINRDLAVKCLHPEFLKNAEALERFQREARAATAIGNDHIIDVTDMGRFEDGSPYIVMEYLEGEEFASVIEEAGHLPAPRVVHIITQICDALSAAHAKGIVHRDLKPENVFLVRKRREPDFVKVLDFGISKIRESAEQIGGSLTQTGVAIGTPYFMAPEQAQSSRDVDHRVDIYALGVIAYRALTGQYPFEAESYPALMVKIMTEQPLPPSQLKREIPEELERIVLKAMAKEPDARYQSMDELAGALLPFGPRIADYVSLPPEGSSSASPKVVIQSNPPTTTPMAWSDTVAAGETDPLKKKRRRLAILAVPIVLIAGTLTWFAIHFARDTSVDPPMEKDEQTGAAIGLARPSTLEKAVDPAPKAGEQVLTTGVLESGKPSEVRVRITTMPSDAKIFINGIEFPNPMDAFRPRSLDPVRIRVEKPGYRSIEQAAIFDQQRALSFELVKGRGVEKRTSIVAGQPSTNAPTRTQPKPADKTAGATGEIEDSRAISAPRASQPGADISDKPGSRPESGRDDIYRGPSGSIRNEF